MAEPDTATSQPTKKSAPEGSYVVVARRYRPQRFDELIGQEHVGRALAGAIQTGRVGHAYLFTGARGVGKTSSARIFAKSLNCQHGMSATPCNECDICRSITAGGDVDVLEIDGASNRGIDEIRQLRQNVSVRPSRSRFKIYIIDEVHMLTREAFNALLKTLEEPPEHVKFIFCTTEPNKLPITILSRCQRFDFAGIQSDAILKRLQQICETEGVEAEAAALQILARRAAGSMRDSQSLLEQVLAFGAEKITPKEVHQILGTVDEGDLNELAQCIVGRDAAATLTVLDRSLAGGADVGRLLEQLLGYLRDMLVLASGGAEELALYIPSGSLAEAKNSAQTLGVATLLAAMQIVEQTLQRLRYSSQGRVLAEMALVRICQLQWLDDLPEWIATLQSGQGQAGQRQAGGGHGARPGPQQVSSRPAAPARPSTGVPPGGAVPAKKNIENIEAAPPEASRSQGASESANESPPYDQPAPVSRDLQEINASNAETIWRAALEELGGLASDHGASFQRLAISAPNRLVVEFSAKYTFAKTYLERADQAERLRGAFRRLVSNPPRVELTIVEDASSKEVAAKPAPQSQRQKMAERTAHPMIQRTVELFQARPTGLREPPSK